MRFVKDVSSLFYGEECETEKLNRKERHSLPKALFFLMKVKR